MLNIWNNQNKEKKSRQEHPILALKTINRSIINFLQTILKAMVLVIYILFSHKICLNGGNF